MIQDTLVIYTYVSAQHFKMDDINGLVPDCSTSSALAMEILQSGTKPSTYGSGHGTVAVLLPGFAINW